MAAPRLSAFLLAPFVLLAAVPLARATPVPRDSTAADSARSSRVVRRFPPIEVRALLHDPGSSQTVRMIPGAALNALPVDDFAQALALQPGVVAQGEELHVRGGRTGETTTFLEGIALNEPLRDRPPLGLPLLALRGADLVSGSPEAQYGCGLAGALDLRTVDPPERPALAWRWQRALEARGYDRVAARVGTPLPGLGVGLVAVGDATLDDSWLPTLRSDRVQHVAGTSFDWRADDRLLGFAKLAPVRQPQRLAAQVLFGRRLQRPYDPAWTRDGWTYVPRARGEVPIFSSAPLPGYYRYRAADHLAETDERQVAALLSTAYLRPARRLSASLGWLRTRSVTGVGSAWALPTQVTPPLYDADGFHVIWGDDPYYRSSSSDVVTLRADGEATTHAGNTLKAGAGLTSEEVSLYEQDYSRLDVNVDPIREYHARAPGGFGYAQGRWQAGGMVLNLGLRADYFTPGPEGRHQTIPWNGRGVVSLSPRFGFACPVSVRDAVSVAYSRVHQAPARDFLYDHREAISNRQPLGNPGLQPATVISYEIALKHIFSTTWATQTAVFYRDLYGQVGVRNYSQKGIPDELRYVSDDDGHAGGFELSLIHGAGGRRRVELHYTFLQAWGLESRPEGDPYGPVLDAKTVPLGTTPLSWDCHHTVQLAARWAWREDWSFAWSTVVGSPLPWTPKPRREIFTDLMLVNSERLGWTEDTNVDVQWQPAFGHGLKLGLEARNLFDHRGERVVSVDGYPNPLVNTVYDDYAAYRDETGQAGGAYWVGAADGSSGYWVPVHDPRLFDPPRAVRVSVGANW